MLKLIPGNDKQNRNMLKYWVSYLEEIVASAFLLITFALVFVNVIARYVFRTGIPWAEEFAVGCFVWSVFIGAAACYKRHAHMKVDILVDRAPKKMQIALRLAMDLMMALLCSIMFYTSVIYIIRSHTKTTAILGIPSTVFSVSIALAFLDMTVWSYIFLYRRLRDVKRLQTIERG